MLRERTKERAENYILVQHVGNVLEQGQGACRRTLVWGASSTTQLAEGAVRPRSVQGRVHMLIEAVHNRIPVMCVTR